MKIYRVKYDLLVDGEWGTFGDERAVIVRDNEDARRAIDKVEKFVARSSFGRGATVEQIEIQAVTFIASKALQ